MRYLFLFFSILFILQSCTDSSDSGSEYPSIYGVDIQVEELSSLTSDNEEVEKYASLLFEDKKNLDDAIKLLGDWEKNPELLAAAIIVRDLKYDEILWSEKDKTDEIDLQKSSTAFKWTGGNRSFSFLCFCYKYPCLKYTNLTGICSGYNRSGYWRRCSNIDCNIPSGC